MQQMAKQVIQSIESCPAILDSNRRNGKGPIVFVDRVENRTEEHIDTKSLTDKIRTALIQTRKVRFINKEKRDLMEEEYKYNQSGAVSKETRKTRGKQIGAEFFLDGSLASNVQQVGKNKLVYYKLTMNLTNLETSVIECVEEKEIRKKYKKRRI